jgi:hypothetical protein
MNKTIFQCQHHPEEIVTNYCCLRYCQTPLCPDCIDEHNKRHKSQGQFPEIDTLNRVRTMCSNQLNFVSKTLEDHLKKLNGATNLNLEDLIQKSLVELEKLKVRLIEQINSYFKAINDEFILKIRSSSTRFPDFKDLKTKMSSIIDELGSIRANLDGPNTFEAIKCTSNLDTNTLIANFDKQVEDALSKSISLPIQFVVNDVNYSNFANELKKIVSVDNKDIKVVTNEQYLNQMAPKRDVNVMNMFKHYFDDKFKNN